MGPISRFCLPFAVAIVLAACAPAAPRPPASRAASGDAGARPDAPAERPAVDMAGEVRIETGAAARADAGTSDGGAPEMESSDGRDVAQLPAARPPGPGEIAIAEILVDPAGADLGHEWVEIVSLATETLDLGSLHLADAATEVAVDGGRLAAGGVLVLGQSADPAHNGGAPVERAYGTRLIFNNDSDRLAICLGPCADGPALDTFVWDGSLGADYQGRAVVIDPATRAICPATEPFGTAGSFGSPGAPNPPCAARDGGAPDEM